MDMIIALFGAILVLQILLALVNRPRPRIKENLPPRQIKITVEEHQGVFYLFNAEDHEFIAQGADLTAVIEHMRERRMIDVEVIVATQNQAAMNLFSQSVKV